MKRVLQAVLLITGLLAWGWLWGKAPIEGQPDAKGNFWESRMLERCEEIAVLCQDIGGFSETLPQSTIDAMEVHLLENDVSVMDTDAKYPNYFPAAASLISFLECAEVGTPAQQEIVTVLESGALSYSLFTSGEEGFYFHVMRYGGPAEETSYVSYRILDWELTDRGNFFFRVLPDGDKHYEDYTLIRTVPVDTALYDLGKRYIEPLGYVGTNIFLVDWAEENWDGLSLNDVWEYLYYTKYGEVYQPEEADFLVGQDRYLISAEMFENTLLPYFSMELDTFRELAQYDPEKEGYPWRPIHTNDYDFLWYYFCQPEVTAYRENADGTITLTVQMLSTDLKLDCLFSHEVTIRLLKDGGFQYVGNRVIEQTEYGLPFHEPRLTW